MTLEAEILGQIAADLSEANMPHDDRGMPLSVGGRVAMALHHRRLLINAARHLLSVLDDPMLKDATAQAMRVREAADKLQAAIAKAEGC